MSNTINRREREAILKSLKAGVVPRIGLRHIQVGRIKEITTIVNETSFTKNGEKPKAVQRQY